MEYFKYDIIENLCGGKIGLNICVWNYVICSERPIQGIEMNNYCIFGNIFYFMFVKLHVNIQYLETAFQHH